MKKITFECETITPMFLAGADVTTPELRPPSIKGALRFWWRAMNAGKYPDIKDLKKAESEIFGGVEPEAKRSNVLINVFPKQLIKSKNKLQGELVQIKKWQKDKITGESKQITINIDLLEYLCYGTYDYVKGNGNVFNREYIVPNQRFSIEIKVLNPTNEIEVINSFFLFSKFGGLGSRSRNGFGCFVIKSTNIELPKVDDLLKNLNINKKGKFTSFSKAIRLFKTSNSFEISNSQGQKNKDLWKKTLSLLSKAYRSARADLESKHNYDKRIYIASPLIADKKTYSFLERHAKSFFLSIDEINDKQYGQILFLPYNYLLDNEHFSENNLNKYTTYNEEFCKLLLNNLTEVTL